MRALRVHEFGTPLEWDEVDDPSPSGGDVLAEIELVSVNPLDIWVTQGTVAGGRQQLPFIPGGEALVRVDGRTLLATGSGIGVTRPGVYAERQALPREAMVEIPGGLDPEQAVAMGVAGRTAWAAVCELGEVGPGDVVVVLGASGGVGSLAAQLAVSAGATVHGQTSSEAKRDAVAATGAAPLVADAGAIAERLAGIEANVVIDPLGGAFTAAAVTALAPHGRIVLFGTSAGRRSELDLQALYRRGGRILTYAGVIESAAELRPRVQAALAAAAGGRMHAAIDEVLPLERGAEAHRRILDREVRGKLLLRP